MSTEVETCNLCGKEKRQRALGSFTQWLLDDSHCSCDRVSLPVDGSKQTQFCKTCGRSVPSGRSGSMTQWIFGLSMCNCKSPVIELRDVYVWNTTETSADISDEEPELAMDGSRFPLTRYKPIAELGRGGSGIVYLCRDRILNKKVAVKTLRQLSPEQLISFQTEARASSSLIHPSILQILDFGPTEAGTPYMVLEYVKGTTLADLIAHKGPTSPGAFKYIFTSLSSALAFAHKSNIFHRDIKPTNVLVSEADDIKLIDFGVAKVHRDTTPAIVIGENTLPGTPAYMAPDMVRGLEYDARSEIYSLGCVMYECMTGSPPFAGDTPLEVINKQVNEAPPALPSGKVTPSIEKIILKCLAKNPSDRFTSMQELHDAIQAIDSYTRVAEKQADTPHVVSSKSKRASILAVAAVISTLCVGSAVLVFQTKTNPASQSAPNSQDNQSTSEQLQKDFKYLEDSSKENVELEEASIRNNAEAQRNLAAKYLFGDGGIPKDYSRAFKLYDKAAKLGDAPAMNDLGYMYQNGYGVKRDYAEAMKWYRRAAQKKWTNSINNVGHMYENGWGVKVDYSEALRWYKKAAAQDCAIAFNNIGYLYENGYGVPQDYGKAFQYYKMASDKGFATATANLANFYRDGLGVPRNPKEALRLYRQACDHGDLGAHFQLGVMYEEGTGVPQNYEEAYALYKFAADRDFERAMNNLGWLYENGKGVKQDYAMAMSLYQRAAQRGNNTAMNNIGYLYESGHGVKRDYKKAMEWYQKAAALNESWAQTNIGSLYENGRGVKIDYARALYWHSKSAELGNSTGLNNLANLYLDGKGVKKNYPEAMRLFRLAAAKNHTDSINNIGYMYQEGYGVQQDSHQAFRYYMAAAIKGNSRSQYHLYELYSKGKGVEQNQERALYWLQKAARGGDTLAEKKLASLSVKS